MGKLSGLARGGSTAPKPAPGSLTTPEQGALVGKSSGLPPGGKQGVLVATGGFSAKQATSVGFTSIASSEARNLFEGPIESGGRVIE